MLHPLYERETPILFGDHVTTETGTGFVHTAPAHGVDDFNVCMNEKIEIKNPISNNGCFKEDVGLFSGTHVRKVEPLVLEELAKADASALANSSKTNGSTFLTCVPEKRPTSSLKQPLFEIGFLISIFSFIHTLKSSTP